jgi:glycosyltransferase involved in cell wall biosynthesis
MLKYQAILHFAQRSYHRLPLPDRVKWRLRAAVLPFLLALRGGDMTFREALRIVLSGEKCDLVHYEREDALRRMLERLGASHTEPITHVITVPFISTGGAETVAMNFAHAAAEIDQACRVLLVVTDRELADEFDDSHPRISLLVLGQHLSTPTYAHKKQLLFDLLMTIRPAVLHNINSEVAWQLIIEQGTRLRAITKLFANIFAFQFAPNGKKTGYAMYFLRPGLPHLTRLLSDNQRFLDDACHEYRLGDDGAKLLTVYSPSKAATGRWHERALARIVAYRRNEVTRPKFLWAGRLDAEKRVDLLVSIAQLCPEAEFYVFGQAVVDGRSSLPALSNVKLMGRFGRPEDMVANRCYTAFLFTSRWEGMPNILLEIGAFGVPIVAPAVGGVPELIHDKTGYLVPANATASDYVDAMQAIQKRPDVAAGRAKKLVELIASRHTWEHFVEQVRVLHDYANRRRQRHGAQADRLHAMPKVSVVIPCFNQGKYLMESVSSALDAYSGPLEIIVVNDGSTAPKTSTYLRAIEQLSPTVKVINQHNGGLSSARNTGIAAATGEFVQLLDADDLIVPPKLDLQVAHFQVAQDLDVSVSNFLLCDKDRVTFLKHDEAIAGYDFVLQDFLYKWERGFAIPIHCALFRRASLPSRPFDVAARAKEDWIFWCTLSVRGLHIAYLPQHSAIYRQHDGSMRRSYVQMGKSWLYAADRINGLVAGSEPQFLNISKQWFKTFYCAHPAYAAELNRASEGTTGSDSLASTLQEEDSTLESWAARIADAFRAMPSTDEPVLSVIVPVFNHYDFVAECLLSIAQQRGVSIEVVCVDDASTDARTRGLMARLKGVSNRLTILLHDCNLGISVSQNEAVEIARAPFVAFVDCDDALPEGALREAMAALEAHPEVDYLFTDRYDIDQNGNILRRAVYGGYPTVSFKTDSSIRDDLLDAMVASHLKIIRRHTYQALGGCDAAFSGIQDWQLALKIAERGRLYYLNKLLYRHRIHTASVTQSDKVGQFQKVNMLRRHFSERWLRPSRSDKQNVVTFSDKDIEMPRLDDLKAIWRNGGHCEMRLSHGTPVPLINFLREFNSYFDRIIWADPRSYASLVGYVWGAILTRQP